MRNKGLSTVRSSWDLEHGVSRCAALTCNFDGLHTGSGALTGAANDFSIGNKAPEAERALCQELSGAPRLLCTSGLVGALHRLQATHASSSQLHLQSTYAGGDLIPQTGSRPTVKFVASAGADCVAYGEVNYAPAGCTTPLAWGATATVLDMAGGNACRAEGEHLRRGDLTGPVLAGWVFPP